MSWLPSFLNWQTAALAAMVVIPALLVLYFLKLRRREMPVSSTLLWKKAIQDLQVNAPFQRLRRNLLLLLQLFLLILLLLALSRPVANYKPAAGKLNVILIDRSASMAAVDHFGDGGKVTRTRLEEAKRRAKDVVDSMGRGDTAAVIAFDDSAETVCPYTTDAARLRGAIDAIGPTDRRSRLQLAYRLAEAQSTFNEAQLRENVRPEAFLFSDGRVLDADKLSIRANLHYDPVGSAGAPNVGIVALNAKRNYERPDEVQVFARLANFGPEPIEADVQLTIDGVVRANAAGSDGAYLYPDRWDDKKREEFEKSSKRPPKDSVEFPKIELANAAVIKIEQMHKEGDALAADDSAQVVVPPPKALSVLLVTDGNFFLEKALNSQALKHPDQLLPSEYEKQRKDGKLAYDVILFDRYEPEALPPAGNFMFFGAVPRGIKVRAEREGDAPSTQAAGGSPGAAPATAPANAPERRAVKVSDVTVLDWKRDHPTLRHLSLSKLFIGESLKLRVPLDSETLVEGSRGPLVVLHREGRGVYLLVAFDVLQSNWPLKISFPIFLHNALQFLAIGSDMDVRESFPPGATPRLPRANIQQLEATRGGTITQIKITGPAGDKIVKVPDGNGDVALPALDKVGVYTLDPPVPQYERVAVNLLDANESNLVPISDYVPGKGPGDVKTAKGSGSRVELWWWIVACAALPLLMVEWWVYTRRVHM